MNTERIKNRFLALNLYSKLIVLGSFLTLISVFMPWYEDLDAFKTGDMFLGITGPLYLAGFVILLASGLALSLPLLSIFDKKAPRLPMKANHLHIAVGAMNIFLLILVNSVYFHAKFGVNIALKDSRFGMTVAFLGSALLLLAGILIEKKKVNTLEFESGKLEPLIEIKPQAREQRDLKEQKETAHKVDSALTKFSTTDNKNNVRSGVRETLNTQPWRMDL